MGKRRDLESAIAALASGQHGVVARGQLLAAGISSDAIDRLLNTGAWRRLHRGVYQVGPVAAPLAREMAACLACGPSAVASHRSAAALWSITPPLPGSAPVEVSTTRGQHRRPGIRVHRLRALGRAERTKLDGIPVTTPARTLADLAAVLRARELERAVAEAFARRLATRASLRAASRGARMRPGAKLLERMIESGETKAPAFTRSEAEEKLLALIRRAALDAPEVNAAVAGHEVDFVWRKQRLIVEVDGYAFHAAAHAFENDRRRDAELAAAGMRVMRATWRHIVEEPEALLVRIAQALAFGRHG